MSGDLALAIAAQTSALGTVWSLAEPPQASVLRAASQWSVATLSGSLATGIAIIAVAGVGLMMLSGRIDVRRGAMVIVGCFMLFGAPAIAEGLLGSANRGEQEMAGSSASFVARGSGNAGVANPFDPSTAAPVQR
jgi:type IV secretory pathway VirB2 component (pilin)